MGLTDYEKSLLQGNGFLVSERLSKESIGMQLLDIWQKDLPIFISTDAILHTFHFAYDRILISVERGCLLNRLSELLTMMHNKFPNLAEKYAAYSQMERMLRDVDVYLTVPRILMGQEVSPVYPENQTEINDILQLIYAEKFATYPFFSENCKEIDFSQFKPRGHYTRYPELEQYFRAMMWFGRIEIYLTKPKADTMYCPPQTLEDIQRQTIDAALICEIIADPDVISIYNEIEDILTFFIGEQDNVTAINMISLIESLQYPDADRLLDTLALHEFQDSLVTKAYATQKILSQVLAHDPFTPESVQLASAFMLFGQRFVIDSYVSAEVVFDKIKYNNQFICRLFPSTLDVLFALGNNAAGQLLVPELDKYYYATNLTALRYLIDSYDAGFWSGSIYNMWLKAIRTLNPPEDRLSLPRFMQTAAWWQQKINTQLSSWSQLRHDNLLYAKPSYTSAVSCSYPYGYVEPIPAFYKTLNELAQNASDTFDNISFVNGNLKNSVLTYFNVLEGVTDTLSVIAEKELAGIDLAEDEISFMKGMLYHDDDAYAMGNANGWYMALLYGKYGSVQGWNLTTTDYLVVDYHTVPTDCAGNLYGWVMHAGTGNIDLAIVLATLPDNKTMAFAGPVLSYHEYTSTNFFRLTDEEWQDTYLSSSTRPNWVNIYMADNKGQTLGEGAKLLTHIGEQDKDKAHIPATHIIAYNYPNPFNSETIISFSVPVQLTHSYSELTIYNVQGRVVKRLLSSVLPVGNYLTKWDGTDDFGRQVSSGIYFYKISIDNLQHIGKMSLIK